MSWKFGLNVIGECGDCTACCTVYHITELEKAAHTRCKHLTEGSGCSIYKDRPTQCRVFECSWLTGKLGKGHQGLSYRPDNLGLVFTVVFEGVISVDRVDGKELSNKAKRLLWELEQKQLYLFEGVLHGPQKAIDEWLSKNQLLRKALSSS